MIQTQCVVFGVFFPCKLLLVLSKNTRAPLASVVSLLLNSVVILHDFSQLVKFLTLSVGVAQVKMFIEWQLDF